MAVVVIATAAQVAERAGLDGVVTVTDPYLTDVGGLRADEPHRPRLA